tara:strand:+ start:1730 stop:3364 length:1635 start_codon:yes stop_codon:yes gene_type:complete
MKEYIEYFTGLQRSYGVCKVDDGYIDEVTGKKKWKHEWTKTPVTNQDYEDHIKGIKSIGIQPCTDEGMARFGAIDVDKYPIDKKFYLDVIQDKDLPIIPILSKSGGLHLYVFTTGWVKAKEIRSFLEELLVAFKLPHATEVFPKQTQLISSDGTVSNGNFINLPYNGDDRKALDLDGSQMTFQKFVQTVGLNLVDPKNFKKIKEDLIYLELKGGGEEFVDGPPCLQKLTKEIMTFTDGRDRFLYNYMVFAKKKYTDSWQKMVLQAGRKYFSFDEHWTDDHIKQKIKNWEKQKKGFTCTDPLLEPNCMKALCIKRKFGVLSGEKANYPTLSNLQKINIKPNPEWRVTVENAEESETVQLHCKNTYKLTQVHEFKTVLFEQALIVAPSIKQDQFDEILKLISSKEKIEIIEPAEGTSPKEILKKLLEKHIYGAQATSFMSFSSGRPLVEEKFAWFVFDKFLDKLKNEEWKHDAQKTSYMIERELFNHEDKDEDKRVLFGKQKRYPGKDDEDKPFKAIRAARIPLFIFEENEEVNETIEIESEEEIV